MDDQLRGVLSIIIGIGFLGLMFSLYQLESSDVLQNISLLERGFVPEQNSPIRIGWLHKGERRWTTVDGFLVYIDATRFDFQVGTRGNPLAFTWTRSDSSGSWISYRNRRERTGSGRWYLLQASRRDTFVGWIECGPERSADETCPFFLTVTG